MFSKPISTFEATTLTGMKVSLAALRDKIIVINFWFVGCAPCQEEIPLLNKLTEQYNKNKGVVFLSFSRTDRAGTEKFLAHTNLNYQTVAKARPIAQMFNVSGYPSHFIVDKHGALDLPVSLLKIIQIKF